MSLNSGNGSGSTLYHGGNTRKVKDSLQLRRVIKTRDTGLVRAISCFHGSADLEWNNILQLVIVRLLGMDIIL